MTKTAIRINVSEPKLRPGNGLSVNLSTMNLNSQGYIKFEADTKVRQIKAKKSLNLYFSEYL
jgi:hypothetical protein